MNYIYAGVGPSYVNVSDTRVIYDISSLLAYNNYTLRARTTKGIDSAFIEGCNEFNGKKDIIQVKENNTEYAEYKNEYAEYILQNNTVSDSKFDIFNKYIPNDSMVSHITKSSIIRVMQCVLGKDLDSPVDFLICSNRKSQTIINVAIKIAKEYNIDYYVINNDYMWPLKNKHLIVDTLIEKYNLKKIEKMGD
jgi:hypothetical protein